MAVCRELTKLHEEVTRGTAAEVAARYAEHARGEVTVVLEAVDAPAADEEAADAAVAELRAAGLPTRQAVRVVAGLTGLQSRAWYGRATSRG